ncbi:MAG: hypothetical protein J6T38_05780 [Bacteroidaceae bacterium]|nr:hypothetical protein [Bacteroidaceae bacterium]
MKQILNILRGWSWLMLLALLAGCSNDSDEPEPPQPENPKQSFPLTIEVEENPMIPEGVRSVGTRAAITTTSSLEAFNMSYVYGTAEPGSVSASKNEEGKWSGGDWPNDAALNNYNVNWYAYTSYTSDTGSAQFVGNDGNPYIDFTVDGDVANQHDLLVAQTSGTYAGTGGNLKLTFDHVCSALRLFIKKSTNLSAYTLSVSNVTLCNVVKQGYYYFGTGTWTLTTSRASYDIYPGSEPQTLGSTDYIPMDGDQSNNEATHTYLFMIPQTLTAWDGTTAIASATAQSYLEIECSITKTSDSSPVYIGTAYIPFAATFLQGVQHDVKINIGQNSLYNSNGTKIFNNN